jgi:hypothetical protein
LYFAPERGRLAVFLERCDSVIVCGFHEFDKPTGLSGVFKDPKMNRHSGGARSAHGQRRKIRRALLGRDHAL